MDLISKRDALDKVHKTIENLILRLPCIRGVDGEDYCTDPASLAAYNMAYDNIRREIESIPSWHTEDPTEPNDYLVTMMVGKTEDTVQKRIIIAEWIEPLYDDNGNIAEKGEWAFNPFVYNCKVRQVLAWMPLPDLYEVEV